MAAKALRRGDRVMISWFALANPILASTYGGKEGGVVDSWFYEGVLHHRVQLDGGTHRWVFAAEALLPL